jgi:transcriptional regulator with PAS, ATPase and Fis domain
VRLRFPQFSAIESIHGESTLFLDETGGIPLGLQVKLLHLLKTGTCRCVDGIELLRANFRLISSTHRPRHSMVEKERFRNNLY